MYYIHIIFCQITFLSNRGHAVNDKLNGYIIWGAVVSEVEVDLLTGKEFEMVFR